MRIPLDYYRILGLPILATAEQLKQAKSDRLMQSPRREFSDNAVDSRVRLLNQAYDMLSDPETRRTYDARFLATNQEPDLDPAVESPGLEIDIDESRFLGALLLLQELGEYEWVLKLGRPYLTSGNAASLQSGAFGDPKVALGDIVLTIALACLELGREEWQQGRYDNASEALETGQELLLREGLFGGVRSEIQSDLFKLRPYRILAMLAENPVDSPRRDRGKALLQEMLDERGGIDGSGNDQSGLGVEDFLRFIQQLRDYLTVDEQQGLFEAEAKRPSGVATYLAVYALLAKGFSRNQPALVRRAKGLLARLGGRQDVYLEQSVCSLLLGQTEEASKALERSQEYEPLSFIRANSKGAPDLLPGLCLYTERWFRDEVFPHFRDLNEQPAVLKRYFADEQVQAYLEELPQEADGGGGVAATGKWMRQQAKRTGKQPEGGPVVGPKPASGMAGTVTAERPTEKAPESPPQKTPDKRDRNASNWVAPAIGVAGAAIASKTLQNRPATPAGPENSASYWVEGDSAIDMPLTNGKVPDPIEPDAAPDAAPIVRTGKRRMAVTEERSNRPNKSLLLIGIGLAALAGFLLIRLLKPQPAKLAASPNSISMNGLEISLSEPVLQIPEVVSGGIQGDLSADTAKQVLELWLTAKRGAMGSGYTTNQLSQVLVDPKLSEWQGYSEEAKRDGWYKDYKHAVKVDKVEVNPSDPNQAAVTATVDEFEQFYTGGQLSDTRQDNLSLTYGFVKQDNQWKIKSW